ncbi:MAG: hypothetical protein FJY29_08995 [Betaproteobacteria bacterium]|nr:hypothetical protein [Betaproteobacteria bacterium]
MNNKNLFGLLEDKLTEHREALRELNSQYGARSADYKQGFEDALNLVNKLSTDLAREISVSAVYDHPPHPHPRSRTYRSEPAEWWIEDTNSDSLKSFIASRSNEIGTVNNGKSAVIVFDLDGTLFDVGHRTLGILKRWMSSPECSHFPKPLIKKIEGIGFNHIGYSLSHAFENAGLDMRNPDVMEVLVTVERFWRKKFFDGETLVEFDAVYTGASEFVWFCKKMGLKIVYLTGRSHKVMHAGTCRQLEKFGFPLEDAELILKLNTVTDDAVFKEEAFRAIAAKHNIVGNFENEYVNIRGMVQCEPRAVHVVVDSQHSGRPVAALPEKVYRIQSFA